MEDERSAPPIHASEERCKTEGWVIRLRTNYIWLILRYRQESLTDIINTYPAKSRPIVPTAFRTTLNALIVTPFKLISPLL
jgi:hypothetical protein